MRRASVYPQRGFGTEGSRRLQRIRSGFQILINFSERGGAAAVMAETGGWLAGRRCLVGGRCATIARRTPNDFSGLPKPLINSSSPEAFQGFQGAAQWACGRVGWKALGCGCLLVFTAGLNVELFIRHAVNAKSCSPIFTPITPI